MISEEDYKKFFCGVSDVSKAELLRRAIAAGKKRGYKLTGYRRLKRKQLNAIVNKESN